MPSGDKKNSPRITRYKWPDARVRRDDEFVLVRRLRRIVERQTYPDTALAHMASVICAVLLQLPSRPKSALPGSGPASVLCHQWPLCTWVR
jgi:hypothetical protein